MHSIVFGYHAVITAVADWGLIVNADDFGQSAGINRGIIEAHECGIVTSASLMVRWPASEAAANYARSRPPLSVGLHVDLAEWICQDGHWSPLYERVDCADPTAVEREIRAQLELCRQLLGANPTHLDSHQHVHRREPVASILARVADECGIPLRHCSSRVRYDGGFYGQTAAGKPLPDRISPQALVAWIGRLPEGITELGCHPGYADDLESAYRTERVQEVRTLCAREVRDAIAEGNIRLMSFHDLRAAAAGDIHARRRPT